jgi:hypothetical protein
MYNTVEDKESSVYYVDDDPDNCDHKVRLDLFYASMICRIKMESKVLNN